MRGKWLTLGVLTIIVTGGVAGILWYFRNVQAANPQQQPAPAPVVRPSPDLILSARIQAPPNTLVDVPVPISGIATVFHAEAGDNVYEGQLLVEIRSGSLELAEQTTMLELEKSQERVHNLESLIAAARLEASRASADAIRARSEFDRASRNYQRQKMLLAEGATPRLVFEKAEKDYKALEEESQTLTTAARQADERVASLSRDLDNFRTLLDGRVADMESAKARVAAGLVTAPVSGVIASRRGQAGDELNPTIGDLFTIATDLSVLEAVVEPSPDDLELIKPGQPALITTADTAGEPLQGEVASVQDGKVTIRFSNPNPLVKPGQTAEVRIRVK